VSKVPCAPTLFVGRIRDLQRLQSLSEDNRVVMVSGPAGVGKTALVARLCQRIEQRARQSVLWVTCREGWTLESCLLLAGRQLEAKGKQGVADVLANPDESSNQRARLLVSVLSENDWLLVLDDIHLMEPDFLRGFLAHARQYLDRSRIILLSRERSDTCSLVADAQSLRLTGLGMFAPESFGFPSQYCAFSVNSFADTVGRRPLAMMLGAWLARVDSWQLEALTKELVVRLSADPGFEPEPWLLDELASCLDEAERELVNTLCVLRSGAGKELLDALFAGIDVEAACQGLERKGLLTRAEDEVELHALVRELFRHRLADEKAIHQICFRAISELAKTRRGSERSLVLREAFHHAYEAGDRANALETLSLAGKEMERQGMAFELLQMIESCLQAGFELGLNVYLQRCRILRRLGRLDEALSELARLAELSPQTRYLAEIFWQKGCIAQDRNEYDRALRSYYRGLEAANLANVRSTAAKILNAIATVCKDRGEYVRARSFYLQAVREAEASEDEVQRLFSLHNLARIHYFKGELDSAIELLECVAADAKAADLLDTRALARNGLAEVYRSRGELERAAKLYEENLFYYEKTGNRFGLAFSSSNIAEVEAQRGRLDKARARFEEALSLSRSLGNPFGIATTLVRFGQLHRLLGDFERSEQYYVEAHGLMERIGHRYGLAEILSCQATLCIEQGRNAQAQRFLDQSLELRELLGDQRGKAHVLAQRATMHRERGALRLAERLYAQSLTIFDKLDDAVGLAIVRSGLACVHRENGAFDLALVRFNESLLGFEAAGDVLGWARVMIEVGHLYRGRGVYDAAETHYDEALALFGEIGEHIGQAAALEGIAVIRCDQGRYGEAQELFSRGLSLRRRIEGSLCHARTLDNLGFLAAQRGDLAQARRLHERSLETLAALDNKREIQKTLGCLANIHAHGGDYEEASRLIQEAYRCARDLSDRRGMAIALHQSGRVLHHQGQLERSSVLFESSLSIKRELEDKRGIVATLVALGDVWLARCDFERSTELFEEAVQIAEASGYDRDGFAARCGLAEIAFRTGRKRRADGFANELRELAASLEIPECSARLSRLWALFAADEGRRDDATYLLRYARDLYGDLRRSFELSIIEGELEALSKDSLLDRLDRRTRLVERIEEVEATVDGIGTSSFGCILGVRGDNQLNESHFIGLNELVWLGERAGVWLCEFITAQELLDAARLLHARMSGEQVRFVAHVGVIDHRCGEPFGPVTTLPFRLINGAASGEMVVSGHFVEALGRAPVGLRQLSTIHVREHVEALELFSLTLGGLDGNETS